MIREIFVATLVVIITMFSYHIGNNLIEPFYILANGEVGTGVYDVPAWLIETIWWVWNHWIYLMFIAAGLILALATHLWRFDEYEYRIQ